MEKENKSESDSHNDLVSFFQVQSVISPSTCLSIKRKKKETWAKLSAGKFCALKVQMNLNEGWWTIQIRINFIM